MTTHVTNTWRPLLRVTQLHVTLRSILCPSRVWTPSSLLSWKFRKIRDDFDDDGQLDSIAPPARSNPTARRRRNHLEFFEICMTKVTRVSVHTLDGTEYRRKLKFWNVEIRSEIDFYCVHLTWRVVAWHIWRGVLYLKSATLKKLRTPGVWIFQNCVRIVRFSACHSSASSVIKPLLWLRTNGHDSLHS